MSYIELFAKIMKKICWIETDLLSLKNKKDCYAYWITVFSYKIKNIYA